MRADMKKVNLWFCIMIAAFILINNMTVNAVDEESQYEMYCDSLHTIRLESDIEENGFRIFQEHVFSIEHAVFGNVEFIPAIHSEYNRLAFFLTDDDGSVVFAMDDFLCNRWHEGKIKQAVQDVIAFAYRDLDDDGRSDIIMITSRKNDSGFYMDRTYNIGDVLFQNELGFYRDPRISDKLNRFDMNKNVYAITTFVRDGSSTEFLFASKTLDELMAHGFHKIEHKSFTEHFEKFGVVDIVSGFYNMAGQNYLIVYIVDANGRILWNFQPMNYYVNFYSITEISLKDIDGDGNKDFTITARYVTYDEEELSYIQEATNSYYQRAGYFIEGDRND